MVFIIKWSASDWATVITGVPQGSVLVLGLFIIFINDNDVELNNSIAKFVDDTKIKQISNLRQ